mgnify:CR=1 FL=1
MPQQQPNFNFLTTFWIVNPSLINLFMIYLYTIIQWRCTISASLLGLLLSIKTFPSKFSHHVNANDNLAYTCSTHHRIIVQAMTFSPFLKQIFQQYTMRVTHNIATKWISNIITRPFHFVLPKLSIFFSPCSFIMCKHIWNPKQTVFLSSFPQCETDTHSRNDINEGRRCTSWISKQD